MIFPIITHIDQIREAIEGRPEFTITVKDGYQVANYNVSFEDTFPEITDYKTALLRECRGLIFDMDGYLLSRPFNKFFNVNEREETKESRVDLSQPHIVLDKLDGSMIRPVRINGEMRLCTKAGITEQSLMCEEFISKHPNRDNYYTFFDFCVNYGYTPIFEYCTRKQQIVLDYPEEKLVLTAVRENKSGVYVLYKGLQEVASELNIPVVDVIEVPASGVVGPILASVRRRENVEGVVIRFDHGTMLKVKTDWYCERHAAKDSLLQEKNLIRLALEEKIDDILPLLDDQFRERVNVYLESVKTGIKRTQERISDIVDGVRYSIGESRKEQALFINQHVSSPYRPLVFNALDGKNVRTSIHDRILKHTSSGPKLDEVRELFNANWN